MSQRKSAGAKALAPPRERRHRLLEAIIRGDEEADSAGWPEGADKLTFEQFEARLRSLNDDPRRKSWNRLQAILTGALDDAEIKGNAEARDFVYVLLHLAYTAKRDSTVEDMGRRLDAALAKLRADDQHAEAREHETRAREDYARKKAAGEYADKKSFAEDYKQVHGLKQSVRHICDRWLKGL